MLLTPLDDTIHRESSRGGKKQERACVPQVQRIVLCGSFGRFAGALPPSTFARRAPPLSAQRDQRWSRPPSTKPHAGDAPGGQHVRVAAGVVDGNAALAILASGRTTSWPPSEIVAHRRVARSSGGRGAGCVRVHVVTRTGKIRFRVMQEGRSGVPTRRHWKVGPNSEGGVAHNLAGIGPEGTAGMI